MSPDPPPAKRRPCSSHRKITIEISSSPEPELPLRGRSALPRSGESLRVEVITVAPSSSKSTKPSTSRRGQQSSANAKSATAARATPSAQSNVIEISSDEEASRQPKMGARKQGWNAPARPSGAIHDEENGHRQAEGLSSSKRRKKGRPVSGEIRREDTGKMTAQESPSMQHRSQTGSVQEENIGRQGERKRRAEESPSPQRRTPAFNLDHWAYNIQDLDPSQLEALAIVANAEAGLQAGETGASPVNHEGNGGQSVLANGGQEKSSVSPSLDVPGQGMRSLIDEDGDTIMMEAPNTPTPRSATVVLQDLVYAILDVKPDLDPSYVSDLVKTYAPGHGPQTIDIVLEIILGSASSDLAKSDAIEGDALGIFQREGESGAVQGVASVDGGNGGSFQQEETGQGSTSQDALIECQCCFDQHASIQIVHCPQGHPFCSACLRRYAEDRAGAQNPELLCMHQNGCNTPFHVSQLEHALPKDMLSLLQRTHQRQEVKKAKLEGFEECPFCDWGCVMEIPIEESTAFLCGNEGVCGKISCRLCRKEHGQNRCEGADSGRNARLAIEEAMSMAVIRTCPNCPQVSFVKEEGCNKMVCPQCRSLSCYSCKAQISGYEHFHPNDPLSLCAIFDEFDINERHANEVNNAYEEAVGQYA